MPCPPLLGIATLDGLFARLFAGGRARVFASSFDMFQTGIIKAIFVFPSSGTSARRFPNGVPGS